MDTLERLLTKATIRSWGSCWLWQANVSREGYGTLWLDGKKDLAHRVSYVLARGAIAEGLELDHLCRNRSCINPLHLEAVSHRTNSLRGTSPVAVNAAKSHCPRGHEYQGHNLYVRPTGFRTCRPCNAANNRAYRERGRQKGE